MVGGGVIGAATAYQLRHLNPGLDIVLVEAGQLGDGASGRNAGFLLPGTHTDYASSVEKYGEETAHRLWRFTLENIDRIGRLDVSAIALRQTGAMLAAGSEEEASRLERSSDMLRREGISCRYLASNAVNGRLRSQGFRGGLFVTSGGLINPLKLVRHLAERSDAMILERWPVDTVTPTEAGVRVRGPGGSFDSGAAVLCLNAYLPKLVPSAGRFVRPVRAQMLATEPLEPYLDAPIYSHDGYFYIRQHRDGRLYLGVGRHLCLDAEVGYGDDVSDDVQNALQEYLARHFPGAGPLAVERRWSGTMGFSPDGLPVAGLLDDVPNVFIACGFTGHGMGYGVRFGQMMARIALGMADEAADLFATDRPRLRAASEDSTL